MSKCRCKNAVSQNLIWFWVVINLLMFVHIVCAWKASRTFFAGCKHDTTTLCAKTLRSATFTCIWQMLLSFASAVYGVHVLKADRTFLNVGLFIGYAFTMANWMLCVSVDFANIVLEKRHYNQSSVATGTIEIDFRAVVEAAAAIAVVLTLAYGFFAILLIHHRNLLVHGKVLTNPDDEDEEIELSPNRRNIVVGTIPDTGFVNKNGEQETENSNSTDSDNSTNHKVATI